MRAAWKDKNPDARSRRMRSKSRRPTA